ncbi:MAG: helix-turn-helix domain-containing protein [Planctomycetota bacterium]|jgi:AraC-like DNA-binding protein
MKHKIFKMESYREGEDFPINIGRMKLTTKSFPIHSHEFTELVIIFGGSAIHVEEDNKYPIGAGDIMVLKGRMKHGFHDSKNLDIMNIMFWQSGLGVSRDIFNDIPGYHALFRLDSKLSGSPDTIRNRMKLDAAGLADIERLTDRMYREFRSKTPGYRATAISGIIELISYLSRKFTTADSRSSAQFYRIADTVSLLENHYYKNLPLAELAKSANMSVNNFLRIFKAATGNTPKEYLNICRINKASQMLLKTTDSITAVAMKTGFSDSNYFTRKFKQIMGIPPGRYVKKYSNNVF